MSARKTIQPATVIGDDLAIKTISYYHDISAICYEFDDVIVEFYICSNEKISCSLTYFIDGGSHQCVIQYKIAAAKSPLNQYLLKNMDEVAIGLYNGDYLYCNGEKQDYRSELFYEEAIAYDGDPGDQRYCFVEDGVYYVHVESHPTMGNSCNTPCVMSYGYLNKRYMSYYISIE